MVEFNDAYALPERRNESIKYLISSSGSDPRPGSCTVVDRAVPRLAGQQAHVAGQLPGRRGALQRGHRGVSGVRHLVLQQGGRAHEEGLVGYFILSNFVITLSSSQVMLAIS